MIACRKSFTDTLLSLARMDKDIIAVTTDARGSVTLNDFAKELPQQFVECGIAEQDAVGISAGLAHSGKKVFVCGPACFYVARSLEQVKVDLAYSQNNGEAAVVRITDALELNLLPSLQALLNEYLRCESEG